MPLIDILIVLLVIGFLLWLIMRAPIDATIKTIIQWFVIVVVVLWLLTILFPNIHSIRVGR
jgi:hypothetical protein